jgi:RNA polymerase sigma-70 factor, ECF subfamily
VGRSGLPARMAQRRQERQGSDRDAELLARLRQGDEAAFAALVQDLTGPMLRVAMGYVRDRSVAEEVVQDAWVAVLNSLDRFEGRSSLRTWIFRIVMNRAISRFDKERRSLPFSALAGEDDGPSVEPDRFFPPTHPRSPGRWSVPPLGWDSIPEEALASAETMTAIRTAVDGLPAGQRMVVTLRDLQGLTAAETCQILDISATNQRVLLHRGRTKVRRALEEHFDQAGLSAPIG